MAGFLLDTSGKSEHAVFSRRRKNDSFEKNLICGELDFHVLDTLGVDLYTDSRWSGLPLEQWAKQVQNQYEKCRSHLADSVLKQLKKEKIEEWMLPIIDNIKRGSTEHEFLKNLMEMIEIALKKNGTIVFIGD